MIGAWEDIRDTEQRLVAEARADIAQIDAQIEMTNRALSISHSPGFQEFVKSIETAIQRSTSELISTPKSAEYMRQLQGRVQALRDVAAMLTRGKNLLEELAKRRASLHDRLAELVRRMPRQRSQDVEGE